MDHWFSPGVTCRWRPWNPWWPIAGRDVYLYSVAQYQSTTAPWGIASSLTDKPCCRPRRLFRAGLASGAGDGAHCLRHQASDSRQSRNKRRRTAAGLLPGEDGPWHFRHLQAQVRPKMQRRDCNPPPVDLHRRACACVRPRSSRGQEGLTVRSRRFLTPHRPCGLPAPATQGVAAQVRVPAPHRQPHRGDAHRRLHGRQ